MLPNSPRVGRRPSGARPEASTRSQILEIKRNRRRLSRWLLLPSFRTREGVRDSERERERVPLQDLIRHTHTHTHTHTNTHARARALILPNPDGGRSRILILILSDLMLSNLFLANLILPNTESGRSLFCLCIGTKRSKLRY